MGEHEDILEKKSAVENGENMEPDIPEEKDNDEEHTCSCAEQLEREKAQLSQQLLRLKADFDNFRRRNELQMEEITKDANKDLLQDLLPVLDNFERALEPKNKVQDDDPFFLGMEMVYQGLMSALARHGLQPIVAVGQPFDPSVHEAVAMQGDGDGGLFVLAEVQTGYILNDKILRHTKVLVGQNEEEDECQK